MTSRHLAKRGYACHAIEGFDKSDNRPFGGQMDQRPPLLHGRLDRHVEKVLTQRGEDYLALTAPTSTMYRRCSCSVGSF